MRAAVLHTFGAPLRLESRPDPVPRGEEILVRVGGAGLCHSDLHLRDGQYPDIPLPRILGHEIAGEVEDLGSVLVYAAWGCGQCRFCKRGEEQLCQHAAEAGWLRDGGFAEYVCVPSRSYLLPLGDLDPVQAAPLADAGLTSYRAVRRALPWLQENSSVVVLGVGGLGQFAIQYLRLFARTHIIAVDPDERKQAYACQLGAHETASSAAELAPGSVRAILDFVGSSETLQLAARLVERGGLVMQIGEGGGSLSFGMGQVPYEAFFTTANWGSLDDLISVLAYARLGDLTWNVETLPLERINEGLERLRRGDVLGRLVITP